MTAAEELKRGLEFHQAGKLAEAGEVYRDILTSDPDNVDALNLMGVVLQAAGDLEAAVTLIGRATELAPDYAAPYVNLGNALQLSGRLEDAVQAFEQALALDPGMPEAANNLASALNDLGRHAEAVEACHAALKTMPGFAEALNNLGNALLGLGKPEEAEQSYLRAIGIKPAHATALFNLGNALARQGRLVDALEQYRKAAALDGANAEKHYNYANTALALERYEQAVESFERALDADPDYVDALNNLGSALQSLGSMDEAIASFRRALELTPDDQACADLHWNLALALLQNGDYAEGWAEYEWRWRNPDFTTPQKDVPEPLWDGAELDGRTVLLHAEQGIGDALQFIRYAPLVAARGGRVIVECQAPLVGLLGETEGVDGVTAMADELPGFDCHAPLMSLPRIFGTELATVPAEVPYLLAPPGTPVDSRVHEGRDLAVGFAWAGSPTRRNDHLRSVEPGLFEPLFEVPGTRFFSLQVGGGKGGFEALAPRQNVFDLGPDFGDFGDTAAAVQALDLVITVDTAVAHLAGGMGRLVWVLASFAPGYLWLVGRDSSPWYPTLRLFRQPRPGDWETVFGRVKEELETLAGGG